MNNVGYMKIWDIECTCYDNGDAIIAVPIDKEKTFSFSHFKDKDFFVEYEGDVGITICKIKRISTLDSHKLELKPKYILRKCINRTVHEIEITGDAIDDFFSSTSYFYNKIDGGNSKDKLDDFHLIYDNVVVDSWDISISNKQVKYSLVYGDILSRGLLGDSKLKPRIRIEFEDTTDYDYIFRLYQILINALKTIGHCDNIGTYKIEMFSLVNGHKSFTCNLYDCSNNGDYYNKHIGPFSYPSYKKYVQRFLQFSADNIKCNTRHYPAHGFRRLEYSHLDFINIFNAFEEECHKCKELYMESNSTKYKSIKMAINKKLDEVVETKTDDEIKCLEAIKSYVGGYGNTIGQRMRIFNVFNIFKETLSNSIDSILYLYKYKYNKNIDNELILKISKHLVEDLRNGIFHGDFYEEFAELDNQCISFLEVLVYCQTLRRAKFNSEEIEEIIGAVFHIN